MRFKEFHSYERRLDMARMLREKHPQCLPVIIEPLSSNEPAIDKTKYLVPKDITAGTFLCQIRRFISLAPGDTLAFFASTNLITPAQLMRVMYERYKQADGFLYLIYCRENSFGNDEPV